VLVAVTTAANGYGCNGGVSSSGAADGGSGASSSGGGDAVLSGWDAASNAPAAACNGSVLTHAPAGPAPLPPPALSVAAGFGVEVVASIAGARQLAALPNGDLLVGTQGVNVNLVPNAESSGPPGPPVVFASVPGDGPVQGVAFAAPLCTVFIGTQHGVYAIPYVDGQEKAGTATAIDRVRQGTPTPLSDGDVHYTTSVAFAAGKVYAGVGSGCNACAEIDPTRATIQEMGPDGASATTRAKRIRNAIALTMNPATGTLWAGGAGQDNLPQGHPYEFFDAVTLHGGVSDYGWPDCEENHVAYTGGADCTRTIAPLVELPAYSTILGAAFYPVSQGGAYAFPAGYRGGLFLSAHGAWHTTSDGKYFSAPRVAFVAMDGDTPRLPVDWNDPTKQWTEFVGGFQLSDGTTRIGRPSGIAVGAQGSLFIADDASGYVYRVRPR
jgi:glucose/arabinose dehydrogenase